MVLMQFFKLALVNISHRRTRSFLTIIGIFIGIAAVVALISLGSGLQETVNAEFERIGADKLVIAPGNALFGPSAAYTSSVLTDSDLKQVKRVRGVKLVAPTVRKSVLVSMGDKTANVFLFGMPTDESKIVIEEFFDLNIVAGRKLDSKDNYKALVGASLWDDVPLGRKVRLGDALSYAGKNIVVVGLIKKSGDPTTDGGIIMPLEPAKVLLETTSYAYLSVKVERGVKPSQLVAPIEKKLRSSRGVKEGHEDFTVQTTEQLGDSFNNILGVVQAIVVGIAAISLLVGGIGIMNTMYTSVIERTREIGIMKAIGAKNRDIMLLFLIESGVLGLVGGLVGVILGITLSKIAQALAERALGVGLFKPFLPAELIIGALLFSLVIGTLSGVLPARQASRLQPVEALRYE